MRRNTPRFAGRLLLSNAVRDVEHIERLASALGESTALEICADMNRRQGLGENLVGHNHPGLVGRVYPEESR
jgi:hypothetical protein